MTSTAHAVGPGDGDTFRYLKTIMEIKATGEETGGQFGLLDVRAPVGAGARPHIHTKDDEAFYVLEGTLTFRCGDDTFAGEPGTFVWLPRGLAHSFVVTGDQPVRMLQISAPAGLEHYHRRMGRPVTEAPREPSPEDIARMRELAAEYGVQLL